MQAIESLVLSGKPVADIGTDHGFIPAHILLEGICPYAILTDINRGPLERARQNLCEFEVDPSKYELRLGSGFETLSPGEADSVIIAGMGGELMVSMFQEAPFDLSCISRFVLQPRTHEEDLRSWLTQNGYCISDCILAREKDRICEIYAFEPVTEGISVPDTGLISEALLHKGDPLLVQYLDLRIAHARAILGFASRSVSEEGTIAAQHYSDILDQLTEMRKNV